jgi:DNA-binding response OmpR family regulator
VTDRVVYCPSCTARYDVARSLIEDAPVVLLCGACGHAARAGAFEDAEAQSVTSAPPKPIDEAQKPRVVVGHEVPAATRSVAHALRRAGFAPVFVSRGEQVLAACDPAMPERPVAVILDVAIPGVLAFEVIEQLRAHPATRAMPIVLLASVFERTRYKRRATNLYGADAYLELHHVPDRLGALVEALIAQRAAPDERLQAPVERARAATLRGTVETVDDDALRRYARRLLSDVVLYHGDEVADGVRRGVPLALVTTALDTARELLGSATAHTGQAPERATALFDAEVAALTRRLLERDAIRGATQGHGHG